MRFPKNPFKFGTVVQGDFFTNRTAEIQEFSSILNSENHLILIGPRRFGKTSLIRTITAQSGRPVVYLDALMLTSAEDFSVQFLNKLFRLYPFERIKNMVKQFRLTPTLSMNPLSGEVEVSFSGSKSEAAENYVLEDALNLAEKLSRPDRKLIVVIDEFQEVMNFGSGFDRQLRSVIQHHQNINYVLTGSQESLMRSLFEQKKAPFYHFGMLRYLGKIPHDEFLEYLSSRFSTLQTDAQVLAEAILQITGAHPYYTQQLAWQCWEVLRLRREEGLATLPDEVATEAAEKLTIVHDLDFDRLWNGLGTTDRKLLTRLSEGPIEALNTVLLTQTGLSAVSTAHSALKRLSESGIVIKSDSGYFIDDPFFARWIQRKRRA